MNEITAIRRAAAPKVVTTPSLHVGDLMQRFLQPSRTINEIERHRSFAVGDCNSLLCCFGYSDEELEARRSLTSGWGEREIEKARWAIKKVPSADDIARWRAAVVAAAQPATQAEATVLVGVLMDTLRARDTEAAQITLSSILYVLEDKVDRTLPSGFIIASTVDQALRSLKFAPAPSEVLELARAADDRFCRAVQTVQMLAEIRHEAALIADATPGQVLAAPPYVQGKTPRMWRPQLLAKPREALPYDPAL